MNNNKRKNTNINSSPELEPYPKRLKFNGLTELIGTNGSLIPIINLNSNKRQKTEHFSENGNMEMEIEIDIFNEERINCYYLDFY